MQLSIIAFGEMEDDLVIDLGKITFIIVLITRYKFLKEVVHLIIR